MSRLPLPATYYDYINTPEPDGPTGPEPPVVLGASTQVLNIGMTATAFSGNPDLSCNLYLQKLTIGSISMVTYCLTIYTSASIVNPPVQWTTAAVIPTGYIPTGNLTNYAAVVTGESTGYTEAVVYLFGYGTDKVGQLALNIFPDGAQIVDFWNFSGTYITP